MSEMRDALIRWERGVITRAECVQVLKEQAKAINKPMLDAVVMAFSLGRASTDEVMVAFVRADKRNWKEVV